MLRPGRPRLGAHGHPPVPAGRGRDLRRPDLRRHRGPRLFIGLGGRRRCRAVPGRGPGPAAPGRAAPGARRSPPRGRRGGRPARLDRDRRLAPALPDPAWCCSPWSPRCCSPARGQGDFPGVGRRGRRWSTRSSASVGLDPAVARAKRPQEFSGGQCQRISIARALILDPQVIICDEPVSALDVSVQAQILNLLEDMKARYGLTLVFIAHDLAVVKNISDRVMVMYLGKTLRGGAARHLLYEAPAHPYTDALLPPSPCPTPTVRPDEDAARCRATSPPRWPRRAAVASAPAAPGPRTCAPRRSPRSCGRRRRTTSWPATSPMVDVPDSTPGRPALGRGRFRGKRRIGVPVWPPWHHLLPCRSTTTAIYQVSIQTPKGDILMDLDPALAPMTVNHFVVQARNGFYDGLTFHRVVPGFVIQGGDPSGQRHRRPGLQVRRRAGQGRVHARRGGHGQRRSRHQRLAVLHLHRGLPDQARQGLQPLRPRTSGIEVAQSIEVGDVMTSVGRCRSDRRSRSIGPSRPAPR